MPPPPALPTDICWEFYILLSLPWFLYPRREPMRSLRQPWEGGKQPHGRFSVCPKSFLHLLGEREGSCAAFGLQFHFNFVSLYVFPQIYSPSPWLSACHQKFSRDFIVWTSVAWLAQDYPCREACTSDSRLQLGVLIFCALWYISVSPK